MGATRCVNLTQEKLTDVMHEIGMTEGFDIGLEMSGSQPGLSDMIHNMKHGGKIALLGLQRQDATVDLGDSDLQWVEYPRNLWKKSMGYLVQDVYDDPGGT